MCFLYILHGTTNSKISMEINNSKKNVELLFSSYGRKELYKHRNIAN